MTKEAIQTHSWILLSHPLYSLGLVLINFQIFRPLSNALCGVSLNSEAELRPWLNELFDSISADFHERSIENLGEYWEELVNIKKTPLICILLDNKILTDVIGDEKWVPYNNPSGSVIEQYIVRSLMRIPS
ncbi:hypothetical protein GQX74_010020 [Glossina fuscipes]|nr:hypothetical protein GQX74_010020 [Glossina fuscipes]